MILINILYLYAITSAQIAHVKSIASAFEKLAAHESGPKKAVYFTKLQNLEESTRDSIGDVEVEESHLKVDLSKVSHLCDEMKANRPVIRRAKRRLKKSQNRTDISITEDVDCPQQPAKSEGCSSKNNFPDFSL